MTDVKRKGFRQWRLEFYGAALAGGIHCCWLSPRLECCKQAKSRSERIFCGSYVVVEAEVRGDSGGQG